MSAANIDCAYESLRQFLVISAQIGQDPVDLARAGIRETVAELKKIRSVDYMRYSLNQLALLGSRFLRAKINADEAYFHYQSTYGVFNRRDRKDLKSRVCYFLSVCENKEFFAKLMSAIQNHQYIVD